MGNRITFTVLLIAILAFAAPGAAQDDPEWRKPNAGLSLTVLDTGRIAMPDSYAWKGGGKTKRDWPILVFLLRHPRGTILVDAGCVPMKRSWKWLRIVFR